MNWLYKGEEMTSLEDFPPSTFGFTYRVTHIPSGKMYIGKKVNVFIFCILMDSPLVALVINLKVIMLRTTAALLMHRLKN